MVKIRLMRIGKKNSPIYRIVVMDSREKRSGRVLDIIGYVNPKKDEEIRIDLEKLNTWHSYGAQMTPRVESLVKIYKKLNKLN